MFGGFAPDSLPALDSLARTEIPNSIVPIQTAIVAVHRIMWVEKPDRTRMDIFDYLPIPTLLQIAKEHRL